MGLFDDALGALSGGDAGDLMSQVTGALGNGGLQDLVAKFQHNGAGDLVQSWISTGANLPVSADQLQAVLGSESVQQLAGQFGIDATQLPALLPEVINRLTPNGQLPDNLGDVLGGLGGKDGLGGLISGFLKT
ncbi:hypothetical protein ABI_12240 [Asticcacaulis biprosthecium C19]|uniref:DUF937 domain-containing protein n=1 Tax=Asticcacaulis biprosthecium C19 TaxID=715226 RepID=F4QHP9_9CAUL|nr:YidB family protein [Asticcacaulis biprosthecium]EGF92786.1 hypothetical protein ABI_12240 [Asticcacaulis biprosthecium C19]